MLGSQPDRMTRKDGSRPAVVLPVGRAEGRRGVGTAALFHTDYPAKPTATPLAEATPSTTEPQL